MGRKTLSNSNLDIFQLRQCDAVISNSGHLSQDCSDWQAAGIKPSQTKHTWVFPPVLSCTALLERAVLAAKDLNEAPKMLLIPKAISSCRRVGPICLSLSQSTANDAHEALPLYADDYLISIDGVVVFDRIDLCHRECNGKPHDSHGEGVHCCGLKDFHVRSDWWLIPGNGHWVTMESLHGGITPNSSVAVKTTPTASKTEKWNWARPRLYIWNSNHRKIKQTKCILARVLTTLDQKSRVLPSPMLWQGSVKMHQSLRRPTPLKLDMKTNLEYYNTTKQNILPNKSKWCTTIHVGGNRKNKTKHFLHCHNDTEPFFLLT